METALVLVAAEVAAIAIIVAIHWVAVKVTDRIMARVDRREATREAMREAFWDVGDDDWEYGADAYHDGYADTDRKNPW